MLRSRSNTLVSVRRVTEINAGRKTAGIDGQVVADCPREGRAGRLGAAPARPRGQPMPGQAGVSSPRPDGNQRPLGIPVIMDRCLQARVARMRWNRSGRRGSSRDPMDFGPAAAATTRSRRSSDAPRARTRSGSGFLTRTWQRRSTESTMITYWPPSDSSPPGDWSSSGSRRE